MGLEDGLKCARRSKRSDRLRSKLRLDHFAVGGSVAVPYARSTRLQLAAGFERPYSPA